MIGDDISKSLRRSGVPSINISCTGNVRFLGERAGGDACGAVSAGERVRIPVVVWGLRVAAARSYGQRLPCRDLQRIVVAGSHR